MAQNHICPGKVLDFTNGTGEDILSGHVVVVGDVIGVATVDILPTEMGVVAVAEVWELPKAVEALAQGKKVYWDVDGDPKSGVVGSGALTATEAGNIYAGFVAVAAVADGVTVAVKLNG